MNIMTKCLKCAIKTNVYTKENVYRIHKCIDCLNGIETRKCEDCGDILVYCKITKYGHDGNTTRNCMWFKPKQGEKEIDYEKWHREMEKRHPEINKEIYKDKR